MPKGIKRCPECGSDIGAAAKTCYCGYKFYKFKTTRVKGNEVDWKTLEPGDKIKLVSEDRWVKDDKNVRVGHRGVFDVIEVTDTGLVLHNIKGCCFQEMATLKSSVGFERLPPKIVKIKKCK